MSDILGGSRDTDNLHNLDVSQTVDHPCGARTSGEENNPPALTPNRQEDYFSLSFTPLALVFSSVLALTCSLFSFFSPPPS